MSRVELRPVMMIGLGVLVASSAIAGARGVLLPGTQPNDGTGDPAFPEFLNNRAPGILKDIRECELCHGDYRDAGDRLYEMADTWKGSMMAHSARDPLFWAALDIANQDDAALGDVDVGDFCLRCHVPNAWYQGRSHCDTAWGEEFDGSCIERDIDRIGEDFSGISCHFCHRMYDASDPPPDNFLDPDAPRVGNAQIYLTIDGDEVRGPYDDAQTFWHPWEQSQLHLSSDLCGQCHDVTNPVLNRRDPDTGADLGYLMPIERTFSEWQQSVYADPSAPEHARCQDCHMPEVDRDGDGTADPAITCRMVDEPRGPGGDLPGDVREHGFVGANAWMLGVLLEELGFDLDREEQLLAGVERTLAFLRERTADISLTADAVVAAGGVLPATVRVTNLTGHKLPTGYPEGRRMFLNLRAGVDLDMSGDLSPAEVATELGHWESTTGELREEGTKVYQVELGIYDLNGDGNCDHVDAGGEKVFHFVRNDCVISDNRIPPLGFVPTAETENVGYTYGDNPARPGTLANWDDSDLMLPIPDDLEGQVLVEARFFYQSTSREYIDFLVRENRSTCDPFDDGCDPTQPDDRSNRSEKIHELWERHGRSAPILVDVDRVMVDVTPAPTGACCFGDRCFDDYRQGQCEREVGVYQGDGVNCGGVICVGSFDPRPGEASRGRGVAAPMLVTERDADGTLQLSYEPACDALDHALVWGRLGDVRTGTYQGMTCGLGVAGEAMLEPLPGEDAVFFLVVGRTPGSEGSYGRWSDDTERPEAAALAPCDLIQQPGPACDD